MNPSPLGMRARSANNNNTGPELKPPPATSATAAIKKPSSSPTPDTPTRLPPSPRGMLAFGSRANALVNAEKNAMNINPAETVSSSSALLLAMPSIAHPPIVSPVPALLKPVAVTLPPPPPLSSGPPASPRGQQQQQQQSPRPINISPRGQMNINMAAVLSDIKRRSPSPTPNASGKSPERRSPMRSPRSPRGISPQKGNLGPVLNTPIQDHIRVLSELLLEPELQVISALVDVMDASASDQKPDELSDLAMAIIQYFEANGNVIMQLLKHIIRREVDSTTDVTTLFRGNHLSTRLLSSYAKLHGAKFLRQFQPAILLLINSNECSQMEIDPSRLKPGQDANANVLVLQKHCDQFLNTLSRAVEIPTGFIEICSFLTREVEKRFPTGNARYVAVGGFLFLRLLCPAVVSPELHDLAPIESVRDSDVRRALVLVSKVLQVLGNGQTQMNAKEGWMQTAYPYLQSKMPANPTSSGTTSIGALPQAQKLDPSRQAQLLRKIQPYLSRHIHKIGRIMLAADGASSSNRNQNISSSPSRGGESRMRPPAGSVLVQCEKRGWLKKRGEMNPAWKKRWFILKDQFVYYFGTPKDSTPAGVIPLEGTFVRSLTESKISPRGALMSLSNSAGTTNSSSTPSSLPTSDNLLSTPVPSESDRSFLIEILTQGRTYTLKAKTEEDRDAWIRLLQQRIAEVNKRNNAIPALRASPKPVRHQNLTSSDENSPSSGSGSSIGISGTNTNSTASASQQQPAFYGSSWWQPAEKQRDGSLKSALTAVTSRQQGSNGSTGSGVLIRTSGHGINSAATSNSGSSTPVGSAIHLATTSVVDNNTAHAPPASPSSSSADEPVERRGWLTKRGGRVQNWKKRWVMIKDNFVLYFKSTSDALPQGEIAVQDSFVRVAEDILNGFAIETKDRTWLFIARDADDRNGWIEALKQAKLQFWKKSKQIAQGVQPDLPPETLSALILKMKDPSNGLLIKDRQFFLQTFHRAFLGSDLVDWICLNLAKKNREEATAIGQLLLARGHIHHVTFSLPFSDKPFLYQFKSEDSMLNPTKEGQVYTSDDKKSWQKRWAVLKGSYLYIFKSASAQSEDLLLPLQGTTVVVAEETKDSISSAKSGPAALFCFEIVTRNRLYFLRVDTDTEMRLWLRVISDSRKIVEEEILKKSLAPEKRGTLWIQKASTAATGAMAKITGTSSVWQKRAFYMRWTLLYYYKNAQDEYPAGVIPLHNASVTSIEMSDKPNCFEITTRYRNYFLAADNAEERQNWIEAIRNTTSFDEETASESLKLFNKLTQALAALDVQPTAAVETRK